MCQKTPKNGEKEKNEKNGLKKCDENGLRIEKKKRNINRQ